MISLPRWRNPLRKPVAPSPGQAGSDPGDAALFERPATAFEPDALEQLLCEIEASALKIYADHGLPTARGHYARSPRAKRWKFITDDLTPEERFALVQANPTERGWRFGMLADLGRLSDDPDLQTASALLASVQEVRQMRFRPVQPDDLATTIRLGSAWKTLQDSLAAKVSPAEPKRPSRRKPDKRATKA